MYYEYLLIPFYLICIALVGWATWWAANHLPTWTLKKDPRWKNKRQIANFITTNIIIQGTAITILIGMKT